MELLEQILAKENLNQAYEKVKANKGVAGVDGITVYEVDEYIKVNKERLLNQIRKRKYKPQPVKRVQIPKENGKKRNLGIPTVIRKYISAGVMDKGIIKGTEKGTPQGGNLSALLSNIMLNELDKELEERGLQFVRYADDCIIMVKSEKVANRVLSSVTKFIEKKLGLKVNAEKSKVTRPTQTKYLSFSFWKDTKGRWKPKPHIKAYQKLKRKLKALTKRNWSISLDNRIKQINYLVRGWVNYFKIANMKNAIQEIDEHLRTRIRVIIWKQWKKPQRKEKALKQLGVKSDIGHNLAQTSKGYQLVAKTDWLKFAINNDRLRKRGLIFLSDQYAKVHVEI